MSTFIHAMNAPTENPDIHSSHTTGFFTDSTLCIGCKACEVACKEWNDVPEDGLNLSGYSYDNTGSLSFSTWRHVKFVEGEIKPGDGGNSGNHLSWEFSSDVCKHCEVAGCLEACPTGALVRTEFGSVFLQPDVCNGCGYCTVNCPFGVVQRNEDDGRAFKCTFCTDRQKVGLEPACATACPTKSIMFGNLEELREHAQSRLSDLHGKGMKDAQIYDPKDTSVKGLHAFFLVRGDPRMYNLPPKPEVPIVYQKDAWRSAVIGSGAFLLAALIAFTGSRHSSRSQRKVSARRSRA